MAASSRVLHKRLGAAVGSGQSSGLRRANSISATDRRLLRRQCSRRRGRGISTSETALCHGDAHPHGHDQDARGLWLRRAAVSLDGRAAADARRLHARASAASRAQRGALHLPHDRPRSLRVCRRHANGRPARANRHGGQRRELGRTCSTRRRAGTPPRGTSPSRPRTSTASRSSRMCSSAAAPSSRRSGATASR